MNRVGRQIKQLTHIVLIHRNRTAMLPSMLQTQDGRRNSDAGRYTRTEDRELDDQTHDSTAAI